MRKIVVVWLSVLFILVMAVPAQPDSPPKRKEWVWEPVPLETLLQDGQNYILVNPSGLGKTTFLTFAACALLDQDAHYPFLLPGKSWGIIKMW